MKPRFTLRFAALLVMLLAVGLALWVNGARRQREAVRGIERLGGTASYGDFVFPFSWLPDVCDCLDNDFISEVEQVQFTRLGSGGGVGGGAGGGYVRDADAIIPHLQRLPQLRELILFPPQDEMVPKLRTALPGVEINVVWNHPLIG